MVVKQGTRVTGLPIALYNEFEDGDYSNARVNDIVVLVQNNEYT